MDRLSDVELLEAYIRAKELNCSPDFIQLLFEEIERRNSAEHQSDFALNLKADSHYLGL
ncbi:sporulation histidine kinase inhibitor Sda [Bacillus horti]|uniref:Sporulation histidine kinase inhibitor Sda n=1 Tax=Caldalkalibacillus horti TaxID=77523 RepID=A0ABT9W1N8_9BACI|nr:sporulation histidine kinase inhibitor Sda [Bacillus horti]MDQ0166755.1 hypothetical protein [Bacillus horti]